MHLVRFDVDLEQGCTCMLVPHTKIVNLQTKIRETTSLRHVGAKQLASIVGKMISMSLAIGSAARLMTRNLYALLNT